MAELVITITGSKQLKNKLDRMKLSFKDLTSAFKEVGEKATQYYMTQGFLSQGGVFGEDWPRLNRSYAVRKAKRYPGRPMLVRTGKMLSGFRYEAGPTSVVIGNRMPYFKYHQSTLPRHKIPRRAMMGINDPIKDMVRTAISNEIKRKVRAA